MKKLILPTMQHSILTILYISFHVRLYGTLRIESKQNINKNEKKIHRERKRRIIK